MYMLQVSANEFIDATRIGGRMRFVNHSCEPNVESRNGMSVIVNDAGCSQFAKSSLVVN